VSQARPDPDYLPDVLASLPDREVFRRLELAVESVSYVSEQKLITAVDPRQNPTVWRNLAAAWNKAYRRGYSEEEVGQAITSLARERGYIQGFGYSL
jgi:hypothetical protein